CGADWMDAIGEALPVCDTLLIVLSPDALGSKYVKMEYRYFFRQGKPIIPIVYHHVDRMPFELATLHYIDFAQGDRTRAYSALVDILSRRRAEPVAADVTTNVKPRPRDDGRSNGCLSYVRAPGAPERVSPVQRTGTTLLRPRPPQPARQAQVLQHPLQRQLPLDVREVHGRRLVGSLRGGYTVGTGRGDLWPCRLCRVREARGLVLS